jgi:DNA-binding HxlR family transcriptional regulator
VKRYGQRCPAALALDVIGERWTPLIVRELLLGPKRYTDLQDGLPGVGTNILADRLAHLQAHGVIEKRTLPRPTPVAVYQLTEAGAALAPVVRELRAWGERFGPTPEAGDAVRPAWVIQSAAARNPRLAPGRTCELRIGDESFELIGEDDGVTVKAGVAGAPDVVVTIEPDLLLGLASSGIAPRDASSRIGVEGDQRLADNVIGMLAGSAPQADRPRRRSH